MAELNVSNMIAYTQGNLRYHLYYSKTLGFLMRSHVREQITYRINSMDRECYNNGSCKMCGCQTPHLQMANKKCKNDCYPEMHFKFLWEVLKRSGEVHWEGFYLDTKTLKFIKEEEWKIGKKN